MLTISRDELANCIEAELLMRSVGGIALRRQVRAIPMPSAAIRCHLPHAIMPSHTISDHLHRQVVLDALSTRPFFGDQPPNKLDTLQPFLYPQHFAAGDTFYKEGDMGGTFYLLLHGRVQISAQISTINDDGKEVSRSKVLHTYSEASEMPWFGELAVWLNKPQGGTATALMHTCCLALRREDFERLNQLMPEFRSYLTKKAKFWKGITGQHTKDGHGVMQEAQLLQVLPLRALPARLRACLNACMRAGLTSSSRRAAPVGTPSTLPPPPARPA